MKKAVIYKIGAGVVAGASIATGVLLLKKGLAVGKTAV